MANYHEVLWTTEYKKDLHKELDDEDPVKGDSYFNQFLDPTRHQKAYIPEEIVEWVEGQLPANSELEPVAIAFEIITGIPKNFIVMFNLCPINNLESQIKLEFFK